MLRDLFLSLKNAGFNVVSLQGGLIVTGANASITIGHEESGFTTYIQSGSAEAPEYSGDDGLSKDAVMAICGQYQQAPTMAS